MLQKLIERLRRLRKPLPLFAPNDPPPPAHFNNPTFYRDYEPQSFTAEQIAEFENQRRNAEIAYRNQLAEMHLNWDAQRLALAVQRPLEQVAPDLNFNWPAAIYEDGVDIAKSSRERWFLDCVKRDEPQTKSEN